MIRADRGADLCIISIHTPTKGATGDKQELYEDVYKFQSTLPRRERHTDYCKCFIYWIFQSTLPRRERRYRLWRNYLWLYFNPHSHEGSDKKGRWTNAILDKFQSTLPRRERHVANYNVWFFALIFQSTLPRRERPCNRFSTFFLQYFNPHSHEGSDAFFLATSTKLFLFQSTLPRRERRFFYDRLLFLCKFQSTLPRRERPSHSTRWQTPSKFQSTLPRRERRGPVGKRLIEKKISIHTPTKGATRRSPEFIH